MILYRFYWLDWRERIVRREEHYCRDDLEALEIAESLNVGHDIEVWQNARRVARVRKRGSS